MKDLGEVIKDIAQEIIEQCGDDLTKATFELYDDDENCMLSAVVAELLSHELAMQCLGLTKITEIIRRRVTEFPNSLDIDEIERLGNMLSWYLCEEVEKRLDEMDEENIT
jgi:hypothetical protein